MMRLTFWGWVNSLWLCPKADVLQGRAAGYQSFTIKGSKGCAGTLDLESDKWRCRHGALLIVLIKISPKINNNSRNKTNNKVLTNGNHILTMKQSLYLHVFPWLWSMPCHRMNSERSPLTDLSHVVKSVYASASNLVCLVLKFLLIAAVTDRTRRFWRRYWPIDIYVLPFFTCLNFCFLACWKMC